MKEWGGTERMQKMKLPSFCDMLQRRYPHVCLKKFSYRSRSFDAVFIPSLYIIGVNENISRYVLDMAARERAKGDEKLEKECKKASNEVTKIFEEVNTNE